MKVTVIGSLGNVSRNLIEKLASKGHKVCVITSKAERSIEIERLNAFPLVGSVEDYEFLKEAFSGSDAAYLMIPPNFQTTDLKRYIKGVGEIAKRERIASASGNVPYKFLWGNSDDQVPKYAGK